MTASLTAPASTPALQPAKVFLLFALPYFLSANLRAINAVIAPELTQEFALTAAQLGALSSAYFAGFAALQLPLGPWLDRYGPRRVECVFLVLAVLGCVLFAAAHSFAMLVAARALLGLGVGACLMAPYAGYRQWFAPALLTRLSSWMLMSGSLGMIASTLPVQGLLPYIGWRGVFLLAAALLLLSLLLIAWRSPDTPTQYMAQPASKMDIEARYWSIIRHPYFVALAPLCFFTYGGLLALQTLWVGPWLTGVVGLTPAAAAWGVMGVHVAMMCAFLGWGVLLPRLLARGWPALGIIAWGAWLGIALLALLAWRGAQGTAVWWAAALVGLTPVAVSQIQASQAFPKPMAGRVNGAMNFLLMIGSFAVQWGLGALADAFAAQGLGPVQRFQAALAVLVAVMAGSQLWLMALRRRVLPGVPGHAA